MAKRMGRQWERVQANRKDPPIEETNRHFAEKSKEFIEACERVSIKKRGAIKETPLEPSGRQASKWGAGRGLAFKEGK